MEELTWNDIESRQRDEESLQRISDTLTDIELAVERLDALTTLNSDLVNPLIPEKDLEAIKQAYSAVQRLQDVLLFETARMQATTENQEQIMELREEAMEQVEYKRQTEEDLQILEKFVETNSTGGA